MGIVKEVLRAGSGPKPVAGQIVQVHCTAFGKDGIMSEKFWSTKDPGQKPFYFRIGRGYVIKVWDEGVLGMQMGEVARLQCSHDYAYGAGGNSSLEPDYHARTKHIELDFHFLREKIQPGHS